MVKFDATKEEMKLVRRICVRFRSLCKKRGIEVAYDDMDMEMDLTATHANGCPMDFEKLLKAPDYDFAHDIRGIQRHMDRSTGKLKGCFLPRCAR